jgi:hypothetical protein
MRFSGLASGSRKTTTMSVTNSTDITTMKISESLTISAMDCMWRLSLAWI